MGRSMGVAQTPLIRRTWHAALLPGAAQLPSVVIGMGGCGWTHPFEWTTVPSSQLQLDVLMTLLSIPRRSEAMLRVEC